MPISKRSGKATSVTYETINLTGNLYGKDNTVLIGYALSGIPGPIYALNDLSAKGLYGNFVCSVSIPQRGTGR